MDKFRLKDIPGLSTAEVQQKLRIDGYNELPSQKKQSIFQTIINVIKEPMLLLLLSTGLIYFLIGEKKDAFMLLAFVFVVVGITIYQERKTENALEALKKLSSPRVLVIRNGQQIRIPGREVVVDDYLIIKEGDRVPADGVVIYSSNLMVDESLLTGESLPVSKTEWDGKEEIKHPGGNNLPFIYSGTLIVQGHAVVKVTATGIKTEMGKIGKALESIKEEDTLLKKETGRIVRSFAIGGIILCFLVVAIYGFARNDWIRGFLAGLTLSMAMLPEEFGVVLLIFLSLGAWRISKRQVLTRHTAAIETLGSATVLCVDKTGTLTLNKMMLMSIFSGEETLNINDDHKIIKEEKFHRLLEYSLLASERDPFDPLEKEIKRIIEKYLSGTDHIHNNWKLIKEYPLSKRLLALSHVWQSKTSKEYTISAKGAPEAIADLCHLSQAEIAKLELRINKMAVSGLRVIGVAKARFNKTELPTEQHDFKFEFVGLLGFADPIRSTVPDALKECYRAGIRVIMITGDYPGTACHIANQIGLKNPDKFLTGPQLNQMNHLDLREKIKNINIFARVVPEQKLLIVNALKANGEIVAMTGDGVNDAPALKSANIGIAMGERGTDVAREAADLVLLNDDFSSIVAAVKTGRRIFDNLKKAMSYIFSVHIPIAGMSFFPILFNMPIILLPAHIAFLELIIDPACSIVFEAESEEKDIMSRPPRNLKEPLFGKKTVALSLVQGLSALALVFAFFMIILYQGRPETEARTLSFTALVITNLALILTNLSFSRSIIREIFKTSNRALWLVLILTLVFLILILSLPFTRGLFHFSIVHPDDFALSLIIGVIAVFWLEALKIISNKIRR